MIAETFSIQGPALARNPWLRQAKTMGASSSVTMPSDSPIAVVRSKKEAVLDGRDGSIATWQDLSIDKLMARGKRVLPNSAIPTSAHNGGYSWSRS